MEQAALLFVNTALIFSCACMALVFIAIPLPINKGIKKYRISLRFLALAYLSVTAFKIYEMLVNAPTVNFIPIKSITLASFQALLFTFSLITLINPRLITWRYISIRFLPLGILFILYLIFAAYNKDLQLSTYTQVKLLASHPTVIIREIFFLYYIIQLIWLSRIFFREGHIYEEKITNFFSDVLTIQLNWIRYCFIAALGVGIIVCVSSLLVTRDTAFVLTIIYTLFYMAFGIYYIQYPRTFVIIDEAINGDEIITEDWPKSLQKYNWNELKQQVIKDKYYLRTDVNIEEMARYLKIGRTTLSLFIKNQEGMNFYSWITQLRIEEAKSLLSKYPNYSMTQITEMVGYSELSNFSRQFKRITSESPIQWRKNHVSNKY